MILIHHMTRKQLDDLVPSIATPVEHCGNLDWIIPVWWHIAYFFAKE